MPAKNKFPRDAVSGVRQNWQMLMIRNRRAIPYTLEPIEARLDPRHRHAARGGGSVLK
jgi:hypothetical protein